MKLHQDRVSPEKQELDGRLERLNKFVKSPEFDKVTEDEQERLLRQSKIMDSLSVVLGERIAAF